MNKKQSGSVIFLMFAIIGLLALLTATVYNQNQDYVIDNEEADLTAAHVMQILNRTSNGLQRFLMTKDLTLSQIDLYDPDQTRNSSTDSCNGEASCNLYSYEGGQMSVPLLPSNALSTEDLSSCNYLYNGKIQPNHMIVSIEGVGSDLPEVVLNYCGISLQVCEIINVKNNVRDIDDETPVTFTIGTFASNDHAPFGNEHTSPMAVTTVNQIGAGEPRVMGKHTFCREREKSGLYGSGNHLIHVLIPR